MLGEEVLVIEEKGADKQKKTSWKGSMVWEGFMIVLLFIGMFLLSLGLYTAWTTFHNEDLIEPFVCSYEESDMHAREVAAAFDNIMSRSELLKGTEEYFFSGNVNYGYCMEKKEEYGGKLYSNIPISGSSVAVFDVNIRLLMGLKEPYKEYDNFTLVGGGTYDVIYHDCYWWDADSDVEVIYKGYDDSRVQIPKSFPEAKTVSKIGICYSQELLQDMEQNWIRYVHFMYLMTILLLIGTVVTAYAMIQLLVYGKLPKFINHCYFEFPFVLMIVSFIALYSCYERKISLFKAQNHMEMLSSSGGTVLLVADILAGAFILTVCFLVLFLGVHILVIKSKRTIKVTSKSLCGILYETYGERIKEKVYKKKFLEKMLHFLESVIKKAYKAWSFFWGLFTGKSIKGNSIAEKERKRTIVAMLIILCCILGIAAGLYCLQMISGSYDNLFYIWIFVFLLMIFEIVYFLGNMYNIADYAKMEQMMEKVSQGNYRKVSVKDSGISKWSACFSDAEKLEQIGNGFQKAVEDQIHSERMKIELLTNVSHDLKTPLTSIISYVDLLDMEEDLPTEAKDYVIILKKKAERLKTIISEVFELAKTTSGAIQIEKKEIDFYRLIVQTLGDMQDQIDASEMKIKENLVQKNVMIYSDGERMYRVLQNLLDNALKYSLKGTRIYLDLESEQEMLTFTIKNIAGYEMEFDAGDITERFVRGDKNRTTEGSGLGLSIAQGFTIACGGEFAVMIDGDMFKVVIKFPIIKSEEKKEESCF